MWLEMALSWSSCCHIPNAGISGVHHHHTRLDVLLRMNARLPGHKASTKPQTRNGFPCPSPACENTSTCHTIHPFKVHKPMALVLPVVQPYVKPTLEKLHYSSPRKPTRGCYPRDRHCPTAVPVDHQFILCLWLFLLWIFNVEELIYGHSSVRFFYLAQYFVPVHILHAHVYVCVSVHTHMC